MMQKTMYVGAVFGWTVYPPEGISLVRDYLHIHRLSYSRAHTDESLARSEAYTGITLSNPLTAPTGPFARNIYNSGDSA